MILLKKCFLGYNHIFVFSALVWESNVIHNKKVIPLNDYFRVIKIELNQRKLSHHTSIDAILLAGYQPRSNLQRSMIEKGLISLNNSDGIDNKKEDSKDNQLVDLENIEDLGDEFYKLPVSFPMTIFIITLKFCKVSKIINYFSQTSSFLPSNVFQVKL